MARVYAVVFGTLGLCTALIRDVIHGVNPQEALLRGWLVLLAFSGIGALLGFIAEQILREAVEQRLRSELSNRIQTGSENET